MAGCEPQLQNADAAAAVQAKLPLPAPATLAPSPLPLLLEPLTVLRNPCFAKRRVNGKSP